MDQAAESVAATEPVEWNEVVPRLAGRVLGSWQAAAVPVPAQRINKHELLGGLVDEYKAAA